MPLLPAALDAPRLLTLRVLVWRARRTLAVLAVATFALVVARTLAPPPATTTPVVVLARDVAAGSVLEAADLRVQAVPGCCVPGAATPDPDPLVGRTLAVAGTEGLAVVDGLLAGERFDVEPPPGTVVVPVLLDAPAAPLLRPGDRVDLVPTAGSWDPAPDDDGCPDPPDEACDAEASTPVLARGALVLDVPEAPSGAPLGLGSATAGPSAVVAVTPDEGRALAAAGAGAPLGAVLVG